ncbi:MAG: EAL domain-containing protein, partial [Bacilli bacterium]|nr:EAL domain-containing protein [Bacilli bacterium]
MNEKKSILIIERDQKVRTHIMESLKEDFTLFDDENLDRLEELITNSKNHIKAVLIGSIKDNKNVTPLIKKLNELGFDRMPVIAIIGDWNTDRENEALESGCVGTIASPYRSENVKRKIRHLITLHDEPALTKDKSIMTNELLPTGELYKQVKSFTKQGKNCCIIMTNIVEFKNYNNLYGSEKGDKLIAYVGESLSKFFKGKEVTFGRFASERYLICAEYSDRLPEELSEYMKLAFYNMKSAFPIVMKFGYYKAEKEDLSISDMIDRASYALDKIDSNTKLYEVFSLKFNKFVEEKYDLLDNLDEALAKEEIAVYYQPVYSTFTNTITGFEALARWKHPIRGLLTPDRFLALFQNKGLMHKLDYYVWETGFKDLKKWSGTGNKTYRLSFNISNSELFDYDIVTEFTELSKKYGIRPELIGIELTENAYAINPRAFKEVASKFKKAGFGLILDGYGEQSSSISLFNDVKIDEIKIDVQFLKDNDDEEE